MLAKTSVCLQFQEWGGRAMGGGQLPCGHMVDGACRKSYIFMNEVTVNKLFFSLYRRGSF